jgi:hypothetical protein
VADRLRQADAERRGRGRWARLREAWKTVKPNDATTVTIHNKQQKRRHGGPLLLRVQVYGMQLGWRTGN